jgi:hypothetical protein
LRIDPSFCREPVIKLGAWHKPRSSAKRWSLIGADLTTRMECSRDVSQKIRETPLAMPFCASEGAFVTPRRRPRDDFKMIDPDVATVRT